jgi:hypothetical protein
LAHDFNCLRVWRDADNRAQAQTPQQKKANTKFSALNEKKMGKPPTAIKKKEQFKSPIGMGWLSMSGLFLMGIGANVLE